MYVFVGETDCTGHVVPHKGSLFKKLFLATNAQFIAYIKRVTPTAGQPENGNLCRALIETTGERKSPRTCRKLTVLQICAKPSRDMWIFPN